MTPHVLTSVNALYPMAAKTENIESGVALQFVVTKEGAVSGMQT